MFSFDSWDNQWKEFNCDQKQWRVCESAGRTTGMFGGFWPFGTEVQI